LDTQKANAVLIPFAYRNVIGPGILLYPNGFNSRLTAVLNNANLKILSPVDDVVLYITRTDPDLAVIGSGGYVESALGEDIRFETASLGKLAHEIDTYNSATGALTVWVRFPRIEPTGQLVLYLYFGKPGLTSTEADPIGVWTGCNCVFDFATGMDHSPTGNSLTLENINPTTLVGLRAGDFSAALTSDNEFGTDIGDTWGTSTGDSWGIGT
jgi:hypothetical protein